MNLTNDSGIIGPGNADYDSLYKALQAGSGAGLDSVGGRALVLEDLDPTLRIITYSENNFKNFLLNILRGKADTATAIMYEYLTLVENGDTGAVSPETITTLDAIDAGLARGATQVRFFRNKRAVSHVIDYTKNAQNPLTIQTGAAVRFITKSVEQMFFTGDNTMSADEWTGIGPTCEATGQVINLSGQPISKGVLDELAVNIAGYGSYGTPSHFFMPNELQAALDTELAGAADRIVLAQGGAPVPAPQRGNVPGSGMYFGHPAAGYRSSFGEIKFNAHNWTEPRRYSYKVKQANGTYLEVPTNSQFATLTPVGLSATPSTNVAGSAFVGTGAGGAQTNGGICNGFNGTYAGTYQYRVSAASSLGESIPCAAVAATVASGGAITLAWTAVAGVQYYNIYRSRCGESATNCRYITRVNTNSYVDTNQYIAGCYSGYMLDVDSPADSASIGMANLSSMSRYQLPMLDTVFQWMHFWYIAFAIFNSNKMWKLRNVAPST